MRARILACLTATAMLGSVVVYAEHHHTPSTRRIVHAPYTTNEVIEFVLLSEGADRR